MTAPQVREIPLSAIRWLPQVRQHPEADQESLVGLSQTIKARGGVLQPIGVYQNGDGFVVIWGQRRVLASTAAGLSTIFAMVWPAAPSPDEMVEIQLIENTQRKNLRPLELATALQQLISISGMTATQVAGRLGLSAASVSRSLKLLELPEAIQLQVDRGEISASSAYEIARIEDAEKQAALAGQVADGRLTRDALSGARKATNRRGVHSSAAAPSRVTAKLGGGRSLTIAGSGLASLEVLIQWLEELLSKARKVRAQNLELGTFIKMLRDQAKA